MKQYLEITTSPTMALRVTTSSFHGKDRLDCRLYYTDSFGELRPTRKGINVELLWLPALRAALEAAEADAIAGGKLEIEDYTENGLTPPPQLLDAA